MENILCIVIGKIKNMQTYVLLFFSGIIHKKIWLLLGINPRIWGRGREKNFCFPFYTFFSVWKFCYSQGNCFQVFTTVGPTQHAQKSNHLTPNPALFFVLTKLDNSPNHSPMNPVWKFEYLKKKSIILFQIHKSIHSNYKPGGGVDKNI